MKMMTLISIWYARKLSVHMQRVKEFFLEAYRRTRRLLPLKPFLYFLNIPGMS